jgi:uncharacterized protein involved in exopolysaccharide biosynthesis
MGYGKKYQLRIGRNFRLSNSWMLRSMSQINDLESQRKYTSEEIQILEYTKDNVQNIQILKPPTNSPDPIAPKKKLIVILATFIGLFMMLFISFFLNILPSSVK